MNKPNSTLGRIFYYLWRGLDIFRRLVFGFIAFIFFIFIISLLFSGDKASQIPKGAALVLAPSGIITEQLTYVDPISKAVEDATDTQSIPEESLHDLIDIIRNAKKDKRISTLVLYPQGIQQIGPSMLEDLRDALIDFKTSGKKIIAMGDSFDKSQYYLAAMADEVYLHPSGMLFIDGYSQINTYMKSAIEKARISAHIFRVGTYKSAVEPFMRDSMSDAAKEANLAFLNDLWQSYLEDIATARNMSIESIEKMITNFSSDIELQQGDWAKVALENQLIDDLKTRTEFRKMMVQRVGLNTQKNNFQQLPHKEYLKQIRSTLGFTPPQASQIAVIMAKGAIYDGEQKEGQIGGNTLAQLIRTARTNPNVEAIVLRVDSPGGSAFASEVIRQELLEAKNTNGLPIIISMGTYAASGGYWISANADEIWARPTTITGSIGIYGLFATFENTLDWLGIHRDGVGTTELAGALDFGRELSPKVANIIQLNIDKGYQRFLEVVAEGRKNLSIEDVNKIAQGRVWSGKKALEVGLVDKLGNLDDAIESAANLAGLSDYKVWHVKRQLSPDEALLQQLFNQTKYITTTLPWFESKTVSTPLETTWPKAATQTKKLLQTLSKELNMLQQFNDPNHAYLDCQCQVY